MKDLEQEQENGYVGYAKLIKIFNTEQGALIYTPTISDELLQQSVEKVGNEIHEAFLFLLEKGYKKKWLLNATIEDLLNEYDKLKQ